jgi:hypothetical protein
MHIPGKFHFYDFNKYISAILLPAIFMQSVEAILIPLTVADDVVSSEVQIESQLLDITDMETSSDVEGLPIESALTGVVDEEDIPEWATSSGIIDDVVSTASNSGGVLTDTGSGLIDTGAVVTDTGIIMTDTGVTLILEPNQQTSTGTQSTES